MSNKDDRYISALVGKKIPILTMDAKWKLLFSDGDNDLLQAASGSRVREKMTPEIRELAAKLDSLIDEQTALRNKSKEIKKLKRSLMAEIIDLRGKLGEIASAPAAQKKFDDQTRLINDCNDRLKDNEEALIGLPEEIYDTNYQLMLLTMDICYNRMHQNSDEIETIDKWLSEVRVELKKQIIHKQEGEIENFNLYSYMHQIFGPEVIDLFDIKYDPNKKHPIRTPNAESKGKMIY